MAKSASSCSVQLQPEKQQQHNEQEVDKKVLTGRLTKVIQDEDVINEVIDDWGLSTNHDFHLFAQHESRTVYMITQKKQLNRNDHDVESQHAKENVCVSKKHSNGDATSAIAGCCCCCCGDLSLSSFCILCVETLTPIDMIDLGYGIHDATCHCVWTGAFLFIAALNNVLHPYIFPININNENRSNHIHCITPATKSTDASTSDFEHENLCDNHRPIHVLELGCGTGIGSIGIWTVSFDGLNCETGSTTTVEDVVNDTMSTPTESTLQSLHLSVTDADPEALKLCRRNFELNEIPASNYQIEALSWGDEVIATSRIGQCLPYDIVFATDVLYDITLLVPLLHTSYTCLCQNGYFILAHVPRACYKSTHPPVSNLNDYIIHCATVQHGGFQLVRIIHPNECCHKQYENESRNDVPVFPKDALNSISLQEMEDIGAAIFIFQKLL